MSRNNKLAGAKFLSVSATSSLAKGKLGLKDREDLYRFNIDDRSYLNVSLKTNKSSSIKYQVYALKRPWQKVLGQIGRFEFDQLKRSSRVSNFKQTVPGELEKGEYFIRISSRAKQANYELQLSTIRSAPENIVPPSPVVVDPPASDNSVPSVPSSVQNRMAFSGSPDGRRIEFTVDFTQIQDFDVRENFGLFKNAITVGVVYPEQGSQSPTYYQPGDIISFKNPDGSTEYRAKLLNPQAFPTQPDAALYVALRVRSNLNADPDSLSSLNASLRIDGGVSSFGKSEQDGLDLKNINLPPLFNNISYYFLQPDQKDFVITEDSGSLGYGSGGETVGLPPQTGAVGNPLDNIITGNSLNNILYGDSGQDVLEGGKGNDSLYGGSDNDSLFGDQGDDLILGEAGDDQLVGGSGNDQLIGDIGDDTLRGDEGDDYLGGGSGNDSLSGGSGNDRLNGAWEASTYDYQYDQLYGGEGADIFVLGGTWGNSYLASRSGAIIVDWQPGLDKIEVAGDIGAYSLNYLIFAGSPSIGVVYVPSGQFISVVQNSTDVDLFRDFNFIPINFQFTNTLGLQTYL
jgi:hypothetical protein